jgi:hypothetical protein
MVVKLGRLNTRDVELPAVYNSIRDRKLICANQVKVNGDTRFWDVSDDNSKIFKDFRLLAEKQSYTELGRKFKYTILMVNHITAEDSPEGSGGGWHVDSIRNQYKLFMYLTDCNDKSLGPLTLLTSENKWKDKFYILKNYLKGNKFRLSNNDVEKLECLGFHQKSILANSLTPFFVNTSFIHRGAKIEKGERMLVTAYMFDKIPDSIKGRINKSG